MLTGGGTGGHIFPAIAIADELKRRHTDWQIRFVGAEGGMEMRLVPKAGYEIDTIKIQGLQRKLSVENLKKNLQLPFTLLQAYRRAQTLIKKFRPKLVIGTGGYVSLPLLLAASFQKIPYVLNEQNAFPGLVTRRMAVGAQRVLLGNADAAPYLPKAKTVYTGNPVRPALHNVSREDGLAHFGLTSRSPVLLVLGGSLGARTLNQAVMKGLPLLKDAGIQLIWQCGKLYFENLKQDLDAYSNVKLFAFLEAMPEAYAAADLVVSRAGATTISELLALGKPSVLVPSPNVAEDHQTKNALSLVRHHAAVLVTDAEVETKLIGVAIALLTDNARLTELKQNLASLPQPNATFEIANLIDNLLKV